MFREETTADLHPGLVLIRAHLYETTQGQRVFSADGSKEKYCSKVTPANEPEKIKKRYVIHTGDVGNSRGASQGSGEPLGSQAGVIITFIGQLKFSLGKSDIPTYLSGDVTYTH